MMVLQFVPTLGADGSVVVERLLDVFSFRFFFLLFSVSHCFVDFYGSLVGNRGATVRAQEKIQAPHADVAASNAGQEVTDAKEDGHYQGRYIEG